MVEGEQPDGLLAPYLSVTDDDGEESEGGEMKTPWSGGGQGGAGV